MFSQAAKITLLNLRNLPSRLGSSAVIVVGIAGVVGVLVVILAMAKGFAATFESGAAPDRAIVLRGGSDSELSSGIGQGNIGVVSSMEGVTLASAEIYTVADIPKRASGLDANLIVRGVTATGFQLRDQVDIVEGRPFTPGKGEVIAGRGASKEFAGIDVGATVKLRQTEWTIVGVFEAGGTHYESELWVDFALAQSAFGRGGGASSLRLQVDAPARIAELKVRINEDPRLDLAVYSEAEYLRNQQGRLAETIEMFGYGVAAIMAVGALFAALNTMYAAVVARTVEIATLRALGFNRLPVVASIMAEAMALALLGGAVGAAVAYFGFNGFTASTLSDTSFSQIAFDFTVTPQLLTMGLAWALGLGAVGGLIPTIQAALLPINTALRGE